MPRSRRPVLRRAEPVWPSVVSARRRGSRRSRGHPHKLLMLSDVALSVFGGKEPYSSLTLVPTPTS